MHVKIEPSWYTALQGEFQKPYFIQLVQFVRTAYTHGVCYPPAKYVFRAFELCPYDRVRVVIIGQDPYHGVGQAEGLCFSVPQGVALPPSLRNIYTELASDLGITPAKHGSLVRWAEQGVLLLNATLTVAAGQAGSHQGQGWEEFTDAVIEALAQREGIVYILWGSYAQRKGARIDRTRNLVLTATHPSPLSANRGGFFGTRPFSQTNAYLVAQQHTAIDWCLE
ncbi:MAG: uracil-DNA glycosylase [Bacteroidales bacterium]|nr:uracil-DNA glycosylase [Bacteroidales bacterium]